MTPFLEALIKKDLVGGSSAGLSSVCLSVSLSLFFFLSLSLRLRWEKARLQHCPVELVCLCVPLPCKREIISGPKLTYSSRLSVCLSVCLSFEVN